LNANEGLISLTANSLAIFDAVRIDTELMCHANDIYFGTGLVQNPAIIRNRIIFFTPNNNAGWIGMRFGLEQDDTGEKVAIMRLDNSTLGEVNKYNIMIGNVTTMNMVIDKTIFYQSVDIDGEFVKVNSFKATKMDVTEKIVISGQQSTLYLKDTEHRSGMIHMNSDNMYFLSGVAN